MKHSMDHVDVDLNIHIFCCCYSMSLGIENTFAHVEIKKYAKWPTSSILLLLQGVTKKSVIHKFNCLGTFNDSIIK